MKEPLCPNYYVAIMAGGVGSRFWPGSREERPKQFLDILGVGKSLLQLTFERFLPIVPASHIFIVTHEKYRDLVKTHLPEITDNQILGEPSRNNTAPSVAYTAYKLHGINPNAVFIMAPSDHIVLYEAEFMRFIHRALRFATNNDALVTLGIRPTRPDTGYGYIRHEGDESMHEPIFKVKQFTEKPNLQTAEQFVASGNYLWNAGIFIWSTQSLIRAFEQYAPDIAAVFAQGKAAFNTPAEKDWLNSHYPMTRSTSIDYAIMEPAKNVYTVPSAFGWSDLGTWASLHAETEQDIAQNVIVGEVVTEEVTNSLIRMPAGKLAILRGLDDFIIVDEGDVLLIYPKSKEQDIKKVTEYIKREKGTHYL
jgi:mannose-1-phosphate guanylyltransferase